MLNEVWERIKEILVVAQTELATVDILLSIPEATPRGSQAYEGFIAITGYRLLQFDQKMATGGGNMKEKKVNINFPLDVFSPTLMQDYDYREMSEILIVADAIIDAFNERPALEDTTSWIGLRHIDPDEVVIIKSGTIDIQPLPAGTENNRHHFSANILVPYYWTCPGNR